MYWDTTIRYWSNSITNSWLIAKTTATYDQRLYFMYVTALTQTYLPVRSNTWSSIASGKIFALKLQGHNHRTLTLFTQNTQMPNVWVLRIVFVAYRSDPKTFTNDMNAKITSKGNPFTTFHCSHLQSSLNWTKFVRIAQHVPTLVTIKITDCLYRNTIPNVLLEQWTDTCSAREVP